MPSAAPSCAANRSSKPAPVAVLYGRSSSAAQTRNVGAAVAAAAASSSAAATLMKRIGSMSPTSYSEKTIMPPPILVYFCSSLKAPTAPRPAVGPVMSNTKPTPAEPHAHPRPAADAVVDGDILLAPVLVGDRVADPARRQLELPQKIAGVGVAGLDEAVERAVEDQIAGSGGGAAPDRELLILGPLEFRRFDIVGLDLAHVAVVA